MRPEKLTSASNRAPAAAQHPDTGGHRPLLRGVQQRRLAHARLAGQQQRRAPGGRLVEERLDDAEIPVASS